MDLSCLQDRVGGWKGLIGVEGTLLTVSALPRTVPAQPTLTHACPPHPTRSWGVVDRWTPGSRAHRSSRSRSRVRLTGEALEHSQQRDVHDEGRGNQRCGCGSAGHGERVRKRKDGREGACPRAIPAALALGRGRGAGSSWCVTVQNPRNPDLSPSEADAGGAPLGSF